jgi:ribosomal protein L44E
MRITIETFCPTCGALNKSIANKKTLYFSQDLENNFSKDCLVFSFTCNKCGEPAQTAFDMGK